MFRLTKICAEGDNALTITKTGFSPETLIPDKTSDTTANGEMKLKKLYQPKITEIPENKVFELNFGKKVKFIILQFIIPNLN